MEVSLGFFVVLSIIFFPGLIFRRLYFYGEFSKEFNAGHNIISLLALSTIPGLIIFLISFFSYHYLYQEINITDIIDILKEINNPSKKLAEADFPPLNEMVESVVLPFMGYLYLTSLLLGTLSGRLVRFTRLDTKIKLLKFKNYWFYLLNGQHTDLKKLKHLRQQNKKHLFTKADILVDFNNCTKLYSGIVVDYELADERCDTLSKIMLQNVSRYSSKKSEEVNIPGELFVVECSSMKNINLTYVYEDTEDILKSNLPIHIEQAFGVITLLLIPVFIFQSEGIKWDVYQSYFDLRWYEKIISFLITTQVLSLFNPFLNKNDTYSWVTWKVMVSKVLVSILLSFLLYLLI